MIWLFSFDEVFGLSFAFIAGSFKPLRKANYLHKYIHATDPEQKIVWASKGPFLQAELDAAHALLKDYQRIPRRLVGLPLTFIFYEVSMKLYNKYGKK